MTNPSRRQWLKSSAMMAAGLAATPFLNLQARPRSTYKAIRTIEEDLVIPPMDSPLKARLFANENPFGPSEATIEAMTNALRMGNRYPMQEGEALLSKISDKEGLPIENILMGPGSTQLLDMAAARLVGRSKMLIAEPSYMAMAETVEGMGGTTVSVPVTEDGQHDLEGMERALDDSISMVYICNPNNPTGSVTSTAALREFCSRVSERVPVFVDEAYLDFMDGGLDNSMASLISEGKNVIVARTFSKIYGLAGMRVGYLLGLESVLDDIGSQAHVEWGISAVTIAAASAAMDDQAFLDQCREKNDLAKSYVYSMLDELGYEYQPSSTNFILFPIRMRTDQFRQAMFSKGVGIRVYEFNRRPYCRVSMGTMEEMELFRQAFREVVG